jgi:hypothetical protein
MPSVQIWVAIVVEEVINSQRGGEGSRGFRKCSHLLLSWSPQDSRSCSKVEKWLSSDSSGSLCVCLSASWMPISVVRLMCAFLFGGVGGVEEEAVSLESLRSVDGWEGLA